MKTRSGTLVHKEVSAVDGEIGSVEDLYFDDERWVIRYLVVRAGDWLSGKRKLVSPLSIRTIGDSDSPVLANLTQEIIAASPDVSEKEPVSRRFEVEFSKHFEYPIYWAGGGLWGGAMNPVTFAKNALTEEDEREALEDGGDASHLRSVLEVSGYRIEADNGSVGHIEDFLIDTESWEITDIVVDTRNWFPGKKVIVSPSHIAEILWSESVAKINLQVDEIKDSPAAK